MNIIEKDPNIQGTQSDESGDITLALKPLDQRKLSADQVVTELRRKLRNIPGTSVTITNPPAIRVGGQSARARPISTRCRAWISRSCKIPPTA